MRRLVYSPRAYAWVKTQGGTRPVNLSEYIVRGKVDRKVDEVSTAELTIRNPGKKFTTPGDPIFHPMDPVTIWLQRLKGYPVQAFTGYLDRTPYLQFYPGVVTLRASCTLKRILNTFWDPGLPYTRSFMAAYGWTVDNGSGMLINRASAGQPAALGDDDLPQLDDGSIGNMLFATLKHVGGWDAKTIFIEQLPSGLAERVSDVYNTLEADNDEVRQEITGLLQKIVGDGSYGDGAGTSTGGPITTGLNPTQLGARVKLVQKIATRWNLPPAFCIAVSLHESGLGSNMHSAGSSYWGYYQMSINDSTPYINAGITTTVNKAQALNLEFACNLFCKAAAKRLSQNPTYHATPNWPRWASLTQGTGPNGEQFGTLPTQIAQAYDLLSRYGQGQDDPLDANDNLPGALPRSLGGTIMGDVDPAAQQGVVVRKAIRVGNKTDPDAPSPGSPTPTTDPAEPAEPRIFRPIDGDVSYGRGWHESTKGVTGQTSTSGHVHWHSGVDAAVPAGTPCVAPVDGEITMSTPTWSDGGMIHFKFTEDVGQVKKGTIIGWGHVQAAGLHGTGPVKGGTVIARSGNPGGGAHVHFVLRTDGTDDGGDGNADPVPLLRALQRGRTTPVDASDTVGDGSTAAGDTMSTEKATAFATTLEFPSILDTVESIGLQGAKSLMNDQPLFPFVEQLAGAALRSFQSMPNGNFFAFYPDYFGSMNHRVPYWEINDIEIIDGGIDLSDEALATHVYVVGDTVPEFSEVGGGVNWLDELVSGGVVNIFNAAQAGFVLQENTDARERKDGKDKATPLLVDKDQALKFLQRYGARPYLEQAPQIRSPYFEAFRAYQLFQKLWSQQFLTTIQFTFMPELYPGGLVGFPDHGWQCYVEEVSHTFDYETGFTTDANLSSPAALANAPIPSSISNGMVSADIAATRTGGKRIAPAGG